MSGMIGAQRGEREGVTEPDHRGLQCPVKRVGLSSSYREPVTDIKQDNNLLTVIQRQV